MHPIDSLSRIRPRSLVFAALLLAPAAMHAASEIRTKAEGIVDFLSGTPPYIIERDPAEPKDYNTGASSSQSQVSRSGSGYSFSATASGSPTTLSVDTKASHDATIKSSFARGDVEAFIHTGQFLPAGSGHGKVSFIVTVTGTVVEDAGIDFGIGLDGLVFDNPSAGGQGFSQFGAVGTTETFIQRNDTQSTGTSTVDQIFVWNDEPFTFPAAELVAAPDTYQVREIVLTAGLLGSAGNNLGTQPEAKATATIGDFSITVVEDEPPPDPDPTSDIFWNNPAGGAFATAANWTPQQVPVKNSERTDNAIFALDDTFTVTGGTHTTERLLVHNGTVTLDATNYTVASLSPAAPSLVVNGDAILSLRGDQFNSTYAVIGDVPVGESVSAEVRLNDADHVWTNQARVSIGRSGRGALTMSGGSRLKSAEIRIGEQERGEARVSSDSILEAGALAVGWEADALLEIDPGGFVGADEAYLGSSFGILGTVQVGKATLTAGDPISQFVGQSLRVGVLGEALLVIQHGGTVWFENIWVNTGAIEGGVILDGYGSTSPAELRASESIHLGSDQEGTVTVFDGGRVVADTIDVGHLAGHGQLFVLGDAGSAHPGTVDCAGFLNVGTEQSQGVIEIGPYGRVECAFATLGSDVAAADKVAQIRLYGTGAILDSHLGLTIRKNGILEIEAGAVVLGQGLTEAALIPIPGSVLVGKNAILSGTGKIILPGDVLVDEDALYNFAGTVGPGDSPGRLTVEGHYRQGAAGVLAIEIGGLEAGYDYDQLVVTGDITFEPGAKIRVTFIDANPDDAIAETFVPRTGDVFNFLVADAITLPTGAALGDVIEFTNLPAGVTLNFATEVVNGATTVKATTTAAPPATGWRITAHPHDALATAGAPTTFAVATEGATSATYQWRRDGADIPGATSASYTLTSPQLFHTGDRFSVVVTADGSAATSRTATLAVTVPPANDARLLNLSTRAASLTGDNVLIPGFVLGGSGSKKLLIRGVGPTLGSFGVNGVLADPLLTLKRTTGTTTTNVATNDNWGSNSNLADLIATTTAVGAFDLTGGSADAALLVDLEPGQYSVVTEGVGGGTGIAIVELYDADVAPATSSLINISTRGFVGTGEQVMIPGFVISSEGPKTLLIRAVGPTLADFGVTGVLVDPKLVVNRTEIDGSNAPLLTQDNWGDNPEAMNTAAVAETVGAFPLAPSSADAAFVVTLNPGVYTVVGSATDDASTGIVLVEIYVVE